MKYFLCAAFILITSCERPKNQKDFLIKYGPQEIHSAEFINRLMILGFTKYGRTFYSQIYDQDFFEKVRSETLEHFITTIFYRSLSQKYKVKITDSELETWIKSRTPNLKREELLYNLKANNFTYNDWKGLFREQLIQKKIVDQLENTRQPQKKTKIKKSSDDAFYIAVITFEDELKANEWYKKLIKRALKFDDLLMKENNTSEYSWVRTKDLPFYSKIKYLSTGRVSKPIETNWGYSLVRIQKKGKYPLPETDGATGQNLVVVKRLLENFKKDPQLQINTDLLYSLKIKK